MADDIKAIETYYNGYKFRSRTEARWALFFDELQIPYDYEPEGFDLNGVWYLPDFHLTDGLRLHQFQPTLPSQIWVEIKPNANLADDDRKKMAEFVKLTDHHILLIAGQPDINTSLLFIDHHPETGWLTTEVRWLEIPNGEIGLVPVENLNDAQLLSQANSPRLRRALDKARQEQFKYESKNKKICRSCGEPFTPWKSYHLYCHKCYNQQQRLKQEPVELEPEMTEIQHQATVLPHTLVVSTQEPKKKRKRPFFQLVKASQPQPKRRKFIWGCVVPVLVLACATTLLFGSLANRVGTTLFGPEPVETNTATAVPAATSTQMVTEEATPVCSCTQNTYDCADFSTQADAQACFESCFETSGDIHFLDSNEDKIACESLE